jgi:hypothetical protein
VTLTVNRIGLAVSYFHCATARKRWLAFLRNHRSAKATFRAKRHQERKSKTGWRRRLDSNARLRIARDHLTRFGLIKGDAVDPVAVGMKLARGFRLIGVSGVISKALAALDVACWDALVVRKNVLFRYWPTLNGTDPMDLSHMIAIRPPSLVMSTNCHVNSSTVYGSVSTFIAERATSFSGV